MNLARIACILVCWAGLMGSHWCRASVVVPVVTEWGRFSVDWGAGRLRFYGVGFESDFESSDSEAWQDGMLYLSNNMNKIRVKFLGADEGASEALARVAQATYRVKTTYFASSAVRVNMESQLGRALSSDKIEFLSEEPSGKQAKNSKIIILLQKFMTPSASFVVSAGDEVVYSADKVAASIYKKRLMASFYGTQTQDQQRVVAYFGKNPLIFAGQVENDHIRLEKSEWLEKIKGNEGLLSQGAVSVLMPAELLPKPLEVADSIGQMPPSLGVGSTQKTKLKL